MFEHRNLRSDLFALALTAFTLFLGLSVLSYHPADPVREAVRGSLLQSLMSPDVVEYPVPDKIANACGRWGAIAAYASVSGLGLGAYYLVISLGVLCAQLLRRQAIDGPAVRVFGWLGTLLGVTTLAAILIPSLGPAPVVGAGGYLGAMGRVFLETHFAFLGGLILAISLTVAGMLLCSDYWVVAAGIACGRTALSMIRRTRMLAALTAQDDEADEDDEAQRELAVKIRGQKRLVAAGKAASKESADEAAGDKLRVVRPEDELEEELDEELEDELDDEMEDEDEYLDDEEDEESDDEELDDDDLDADDESEDEELEAARQSASGRNGADKAAVAKVAPSAPHFRVRRNSEGLDREKVLAELDQASQGESASEYELPSLDLLVAGESLHYEEQEKEVRKKAKILEKTFLDFGFSVRVVEIETGPVIAQYEVELEAGLRLSKITGLADDLAIALRVPSVRIVAPIPGKNTVGIEVPNDERQVVRMREVIEESNGKVKKMRIPLFLGKDVSGNALTVDLASLPHLLIAGRTGTGKSVCLNAIISSILMTRRPDEVRMLMIDPKMVELSGYGRLPHLMHPVVTDMKKAEAILAWAVEKMEERYALLARAGVRHICSYNQLGEAELYQRLQPETDEDRKRIPQNLPFIVIVADEIADMMMQATGKEVEQHIIRLAQKSRAVGIHLILATQKPTVDVITGLIKSNLPARISFQVASRTDSRVVLDEMGADKLLGNGDMLFLWPGTSSLLRGQGTYLGDDEINRVVDFCSRGQSQNFVSELVNMKVDVASGEGGIEALKKRDELYESAIDVVVREGRGSVSLLQRALGIGYGRAARLIDFMAEDGIVGQYAGSQAREVLITVDDWERMQNGQKPLSGGNAATVTHGMSASPPLLPASAGTAGDAAHANGSKTTGPHAGGSHAGGPRSSGPKAGETMPRRPNKIIPERDPLPEPVPERGGSTRSPARKAAVADAAAKQDEMLHASALPHHVDLDQADADDSDAPFHESLEDDSMEDSDEHSMEHLEEEVDESDVGDDVEAEFDEDSESDDDYRAESA